MNLQVSEILTSHFPGREWVLRKPTSGMTGESYIATSDGLELFIKFDVEAPALQRVAELGVAPRVLAAGRHEGRLYIVQEYLEGIRPEREWFSRHLPQLASLIQVYHSDPLLTALLSKGKQIKHAEHIESELKGFETQLAGLSDSLHRAELSPLMFELRDQARSFEPTNLVPTHADPNFYNFLVAGERIYLLDWDAVSLSDPMRDVGPLLWWYVPPDKWHEFFAALNVQMSDQTAHKVYWWAARQSCMVALLFAGSAYPEYALPFIEDFRAALHGQANPHA
ncbi:MAG TPA: phosphotransferase [Chloroflexia bacterium]|jgi:thiamine kinase-like enzyme